VIWGAETPFKLAFVLLFAAVALIASRGARRAARTHGGSLNQLCHEARGLIAIRSGLGVVFYAMLLLWLLRSEIPAWTRLPLPPGGRWAAVALIPAPVAFFAWSFASIGDQYRGGVGLHAEHRLVTTGAYRLMRHPIYLSFILLMLLAACISANWIIGVSGLALVSLIALIRIPIEERDLAARFPETWPPYRSKTGRLLPRWK
jgi:protein-S-isoprenylcysteine O-methyltransferase Ste14